MLQLGITVLHLAVPVMKPDFTNKGNSSSSLPAHLKIQILYRYWITISMQKQGFETLSAYDNFVYA